MTGPTEATLPELPLELRQILARVDLTTRMLPRDMQQTVFEQVEAAYRRGAATTDRALPAGAPTSLRWCSFLGCGARYDAAAVMVGEATAAGWRRWNTLNLRMCSDHAYLWGDGETGPHLPGLELVDGAAVVTCSCRWRCGAVGMTASKTAEMYLAHLLKVEAGFDAAVKLGWGA